MICACVDLIVVRLQYLGLAGSCLQLCIEQLSPKHLESVDSSQEIS